MGRKTTVAILVVALIAAALGTAFITGLLLPGDGMRPARYMLNFVLGMVYGVAAQMYYRTKFPFQF